MAVSFPRLPRWLCGGGGGSTKKDSKGSSPSLKKTIKTGSSSSGKMGNVLFPEPDDPEWSIGWVEPHGPGFKSEDDTGGGFVVLVPCYKKVIDGSGNQIPTGFLSPASDKKNMEQWLSSMGKL
ncbi:BnaAnng04910D [Brassica napus]|uniref:BnaAnng04910D protein n=1 Tax=Brassica napus TaxID=3708 RepID=A0A078HHI4_BRANA|nr:BnaAnng04910D [Brassica napus]